VGLPFASSVLRSQSCGAMTAPSSPGNKYPFGLPEQWLGWTLEKQDEFALERADLFIEIVEDLDGSGHKIPFIYRDLAEKQGIDMPSDDRDDDEIEEWIDELKEDFARELLEAAVSVVREHLLYKRSVRAEKFRTLEAKYPNRTCKDLLAHYKEHELMLRGQKQLWPEGMSAAARGKASDEVKRGVAQAHINSLFEGL
jgi:hypothetical protein